MSGTENTGKICPLRAAIGRYVSEPGGFERYVSVRSSDKGYISYRALLIATLRYVRLAPDMYDNIY